MLGHHLVTAARGGAHLRARVVNKNQTDRPPTPEEEEEEEESRKGGNRPDTPRAGLWSLVEGSLVFGEYAFPPVSLGPAGDCPCKD